MAISIQLKKRKTAQNAQQTKTALPLDLSAPKWQKLTTPYIVTDLSRVQHNAAEFKKLLPQVSLFYAIKANADLQIIKALDSKVAGYDIASLGELDPLLKQGVRPDRILYSNPVKVTSHIIEAYKKGVRYFAFDSLPEIEKLAKHAPGSTVYLRLKVSDYGSKFPLSKKFGVDQAHAVDYCAVAQDAGLQVKGIAFHVGSQSENLQVWSTALEIVGKTIERLQKKGIYIDFLNLGGGFPADYGDPVPPLKEVAKVIMDGVAAHLPEGIQVMAEPGRCIVADSSILVATIIGREHRSGSDWLYLDVGTFQGLIEPLEMKDWRYPIYTDKNPEGYQKSFVLSGPTCDAYDTLGGDYMLPSDLYVDDRIYIGSVGAYALVYASSFNGFDPPKVYYSNEE